MITTRSAWKLKSSVVTISLHKLSKNNTWATLFLSTEGSSRAAPQPIAPKKLMQCLHDYDATDPLELSFREGDVIVVIQENSTGWWKGELDGVVGLFPSNFTEELPANQAVSAEYSEEVEELDDSIASVVPLASAKPTAKAAAAAAAPASPASAGGSKPPAGAVAVMRPMMAGGKPAPLKSPSAYAGTAPATMAMPSSPTAKATPVSLSSKPSAANTRSPPTAPVPKSASAPNNHARSVLEESGGGGGGDGGKVQVRAMYNFVAQERGELSLRENDVITLLKKDDSGWWQGSVTYTGWFPASFVEELTD